MTNCALVRSVSPTCFLPLGAPRPVKQVGHGKIHESRIPGLALTYRDGEFSGRMHGTSVEKRISWRCYSDIKNSETESSDVSGGRPDCCSDATGEQGGPIAQAVEEVAASSTNTPEFETYGPGKRGNQLVALASVSVAVGLFALGRVGGSTPSLPQLAAQSTPYEVALGNGRPTVVEFYADWCEVCREMAKDVYVVEQEYKDKINFVMLNVDNTKWEAELDEFGVEGIPHFAFLDGKGNEEGNIVGRLPRKILKENLAALARGDASIPHSRVVGKFSDADSRQAPPVVAPRSHSEFS